MAATVYTVVQTIEGVVVPFNEVYSNIEAAIASAIGSAQDDGYDTDGLVWEQRMPDLLVGEVDHGIYLYIKTCDLI